MECRWKSHGPIVHNHSSEGSSVEFVAAASYLLSQPLSGSAVVSVGQLEVLNFLRF
jgi:hypothetical protein